MTETSYYWADINVGDGALSTYDDDEFSDIWRIMFQTDRTTMGYIQDYEFELEVTNPSGNNIQVDKGAALVDGKFYMTDLVVVNAIATPAALTRIDRIILQKSWAAQTIRVAILTGIEGGAAPTLTQTDGVTWEIPLAQVSITTGAAITITDERVVCESPLAAGSGGELEHIETIEGDASAALIRFTSIPQIYTHLMLIGTVRMTGAILQADIDIRLNLDAGANYNENQFQGDNATPNAASAIGQNEAKVGEAPGSTATASHVGYIKILIPNYRSTLFFKTFMSQFSDIPNGTVADFSIGMAAGIWLSTVAVSGIDFISSTGSSANYDVETKISLYGLERNE